ncbi:hypothetical protein [Pseudomonas sp. 58 R 3]|nr:hypothetical protein [Pseudomonas sp. 58 R 3]
MGQAVGLAVQLAIRQGLRIKLDRNRIRVFPGAIGEQLMHQTLGREAGVGLVPQLQDVLLLILAEQLQLADGLLLIGNHRLQQVLPVTSHAFNGRGIEQVGRIAQGRTQLVTGFLDIQGKVEMCSRFVPSHRAHVQLRQAL